MKFVIIYCKEFNLYRGPERKEVFSLSVNLKVTNEGIDYGCDVELERLEFKLKEGQVIQFL